MGLILLVTGIFGGLFLFIATIYSTAQAILTEGWTRRAHLAAIACVLLLMAALAEHLIGLARILAVPLIAASIWTFTVERGAYRIFPLLHLAFAVIVLAGFVAL